MERTMSTGGTMTHNEIAIIGAGPAGLTAAIYALRAGVGVKVFEKAAPGGQMLLTSTIENYPGFPGGAKSSDLAQHFLVQAHALGAQVVSEEIVSIVADSKNFSLKNAAGGSYQFPAVIIAAGTSPKKLGIEGEETFVGKGVSYCATCDGFFFKGKEVAVIGGGNSAIEESLYLANIAKKVHVVHRRSRLRADHIIAERLRGKENVVWHLERRPLKISGDSKVKSLTLLKPDDSREELPIDGVFIFAGWTPNTSFIQGVLELDEGGFIRTDEQMGTSQNGIFACGDIREKTLRQVVTACGDGAIAAMHAVEYLNQA